MLGLNYKAWYKRWKRSGSPCHPKHVHLKVIFWTDAAGAEGPDEVPLQEITPVRGYVSGFLLYADERFIQIAMEVFEDGDPRKVMAIPAAGITAIVDVARLPGF